jgi:hypothetical protein
MHNEEEANNDHHLAASTARRSQAHSFGPGKGPVGRRLVREALDRILAAAPDPAEEQKPELRPIWEVILDNMKDVPPEEFARLPKDGASEHDHYLYGHL